MLRPLTPYRWLVRSLLVLLVAAGAGALPVVTAARPAEPRIVGGSRVPDGKYSFIAFLAVHTNRSTWYCAGTVIAPDKVLTAAHCVTGSRNHVVGPKAYRVVVGRTDRTARGGRVMRVDNVYRHPAYKSGSTWNDVAILDLKGDVPAGVEPLGLAGLPPSGSNSLETTGRPAIVAGWGITEQGRGVDRMREATLAVVDRDECAKDLVKYDDLGSSELCAAAPKMDTCQGDSGGPLFVDQGGSAVARFVQIGVTSWGIGCANPKYPGVYARLSDPPVRAFIVDKAGV